MIRLNPGHRCLTQLCSELYHSRANYDSSLRHELLMQVHGVVSYSKHHAMRLKNIYPTLNHYCKCVFKGRDSG